MISERSEIRDLAKRQDFRNSPVHNTIFKTQYDIRSAVILKVVFNLNWPSIDGRPLSFTELETQRAGRAVLGAIFGAKEFLERRLTVPIYLVEVRIGCIETRFLVADEVSKRDMLECVRAFKNSREVFSAFDVTWIGTKRSTSGMFNLQN